MSKQKSTKISSNTITIILSILITVIALVTALIWWGPWNGSNHSDSAPIDKNNPAGNDVAHAEQYLEEKYGIDFVYADSTSGMSLFDSADLMYTVAIMRREVVHTMPNVKKELFTDIYADNGYLIVNQKRAADYYKQFIDADLGNYTILTYIDIIANPSSVDPNMLFPTYLKTIKDLSIPELIILTDKEVSLETFASITQALEKTGNPTNIRIVTCDADTQSHMTPNTVMIMGAFHDDVQYFERINQNADNTATTVPNNNINDTAVSDNNTEPSAD